MTTIYVAGPVIRTPPDDLELRISEKRYRLSEIYNELRKQQTWTTSILIPQPRADLDNASPSTFLQHITAQILEADRVVSIFTGDPAGVAETTVAVLNQKPTNILAFAYVPRILKGFANVTIHKNLNALLATL